MTVPETAVLIAQRNRYRQMSVDAAAAIASLMAENERLRTQLAEAQKDAQRMDWQAVNFARLLQFFRDDGERRWAVAGVMGSFSTLREAIDAALTPKEPT